MVSPFVHVVAVILSVLPFVLIGMASAPDAAPDTVQNDPESKLTPTTRRKLEAIRPGVEIAIGGFSKVREYAPKIMDAYAAYLKDTGLSERMIGKGIDRGGWIRFIRFYHPEVPMTREEYKNHPIVVAFDNIKRVANQLESAEAERRYEESIEEHCKMFVAEEPELIRDVLVKAGKRDADDKNPITIADAKVAIRAGLVPADKLDDDLRARLYGGNANAKLDAAVSPYLVGASILRAFMKFSNEVGFVLQSATVQRVLQGEKFRWSEARAKAFVAKANELDAFPVKPLKAVAGGKGTELIDTLKETAAAVADAPAPTATAVRARHTHAKRHGQKKASA